jgi:ribonuclease P protein component
MTAVPHNTKRLRGLKKRSQFLRAARGIRAGRASFALQAIASEQDLPGIGFTVTKKTGNSPERNRIKRRLRAAVRSCAEAFQPQHDYVLVGRREALAAPFGELLSDLTGLLTRVHTKKADGLRNQRP